MSKKEWKKQLFRMKQLADQNFGRAEKSEVLTEDLQNVGGKVDQMRNVFHNTSKNLKECLQGKSADVEKRLKRYPEFVLSNSMMESSMLLGQDTLMGAMFRLCGEAEGNKAQYLLQHELYLEKEVLMPMHTLLEADIPSIVKLRKQLKQLTLDKDSAKARYRSAMKQSQASSHTGPSQGSGTQSAAKLESAREEVDDTSMKVEQCRDLLVTEMYSFIGNEHEHSALILQLAQSQAEYHQQTLDSLNRLIPAMQEQMKFHEQMPVYGADLEDHLRRTSRDIAVVIEVCTCLLLEAGLDEEGLFRVAGSSSKVKKLKTAFDAGTFDKVLHEYMNDVHSIAGALKLYLRELPEPLMTFPLYTEWMQAAQVPSDQRLQALWCVVDKMPKTYFNNLRYLIKFLSHLAQNHKVNKMSPSNIAIVIGPNLLWPSGESGPSVLTTSVLSAIVDQLITHADYFFPGDLDFTNTSSNHSSPAGTLSAPPVTLHSAPTTEQTLPPGGSAGLGPMPGLVTASVGPAIGGSVLQAHSPQYTGAGNSLASPGGSTTFNYQGGGSGQSVTVSPEKLTASLNSLSSEGDTGSVTASPKPPRRGKNKPAPPPPMDRPTAPAPLPPASAPQADERDHSTDTGLTGASDLPNATLSLSPCYDRHPDRPAHPDKPPHLSEKLPYTLHPAEKPPMPDRPPGLVMSGHSMERPSSPRIDRPTSPVKPKFPSDKPTVPSHPERPEKPTVPEKPLPSPTGSESSASVMLTFKPAIPPHPVNKPEKPTMPSTASVSSEASSETSPKLTVWPPPANKPEKPSVTPPAGASSDAGAETTSSSKPTVPPPPVISKPDKTTSEALGEASTKPTMPPPPATKPDTTGQTHARQGSSGGRPPRPTPPPPPRPTKDSTSSMGKLYPDLDADPPATKPAERNPSLTSTEDTYL